MIFLIAAMIYSVSTILRDEKLHEEKDFRFTWRKHIKQFTNNLSNEIQILIDLF